MHLHTPVGVGVGVVHHHTGVDLAMVGSQVVVAEEGRLISLVAVEVVRNLLVEEVHNFLVVGLVHNLAVAEVGNLGEEDHILVEVLLVQEL